jgi:hypothetical protein
METDGTSTVYVGITSTKTVDSGLCKTKSAWFQNDRNTVNLVKTAIYTAFIYPEGVSLPACGTATVPPAVTARVSSQVLSATRSAFGNSTEPRDTTTTLTGAGSAETHDTVMSTARSVESRTETTSMPGTRNGDGTFASPSKTTSVSEREIEGTISASVGVGASVSVTKASALVTGDVKGGVGSGKDH